MNDITALTVALNRLADEVYTSRINRESFMLIKDSRLHTLNNTLQYIMIVLILNTILAAIYLFKE